MLGKAQVEKEDFKFTMEFTLNGWRIWAFYFENQRNRGDLIEIYKIMIGKENVDTEHFFTLAKPTYGHSFKVYKPINRLRSGCTTHT